MESYYKTVDSEWYKQRLNGAIFCVLAAFAVLTVRLFYLQVIEGEEFRRLSENNCIRLYSLDPPRGLIFDSDNELLVDNRPSFDLSIILKDAKPVDQTIKKLAEYINVSVEEIKERIPKKRGLLSYKPIQLRQDIGRNTLAAIEVHKFDLPGIIVNVRPLRHYIHRGTAAHVLGYLGEINASELRSGSYSECRQGDYIGKFGIEKTYEKFLRGKRGGRQVEVNASGQIVRVLKTVDATPGHNILLTIDLDLQKKAEDMLKGKAGAVVAMEPSTGKILILASSPSFNQNAFVNGLTQKEWNALISNPMKPMINKALQAEYPPASTYKIITALAGLEEGVIDEETTMYCPGHYKYGNRIYRCWKKGGHGTVNVVGALAESCDVFFYQVGQKLGVDRLAWYANACGLGSVTGIRLENEEAGLIPTAEWKRKRFGVPWQGGETLSIAIGQGYNLATPLQMAVLTSAIATDGMIMEPLILESIETVEGENIKKWKVRMVGRLPVSEKTLEIVKRGLWEVVNTREGTASLVHLKKIGISGKTGTAQVVSRREDDVENDNDIPDALKPHAWFVAYAPSDNPEIALAVFVEHGEHGSSTCGPIARELIKAYLEPADV
ncbi:MAG: penicillin-binding protein 2 [Deltaproteobacteria bacterium]|nr:penicillin-binding protein 2 [Deltaproteobacteria bacterium]MBW2218549.1 penicillin-binding protein 2 [Deltaproteobacteria bacterium]